MALSQNDKNELIKGINNILAQIPSFLKGAVNENSLSGYIHAIPQNFRHYTLQDILDAIDEANRNNSLKW